MATTKKNYNQETVDRLARIETYIEGIFNRLDKINGSISDYQTTKERLNNVCEKIEAISNDIEKNIKPPLTKITIKVYSLAILTGLFSGGIGTLIGYYIAKLVSMTFGGG